MCTSFDCNVTQVVLRAANTNDIYIYSAAQRRQPFYPCCDAAIMMFIHYYADIILAVFSSLIDMCLIYHCV